jgi:hypothetical protein
LAVLTSLSASFNSTTHPSLRLFLFFFLEGMAEEEEMTENEQFEARCSKLDVRSCFSMGFVLVTLRFLGACQEVSIAAVASSSHTCCVDRHHEEGRNRAACDCIRNSHMLARACLMACNWNFWRFALFDLPQHTKCDELQTRSATNTNCKHVLS